MILCVVFGKRTQQRTEVLELILYLFTTPIIHKNVHKELETLYFRAVVSEELSVTFWEKE